MIRNPKWKGFYFITDASLSVNGIIEDTRQALNAPVALVQYREKRKRGRSEILAEAKIIKDLCENSGVPFIVNDDIELALELEADGVHVGQSDRGPLEARKILGEKAIVGVSVGSAAEAREAESKGAGYLAVSPVFSTPTKPDAGPGVGVEGVRSIRAATQLPLAVIGGVDEQNVSSLIEAGADLICAISASLKGGKVEENIRKMTSKLGGSTA